MPDVVHPEREKIIDLSLFIHVKKLELVQPKIQSMPSEKCVLMFKPDFAMEPAKYHQVANALKNRLTINTAKKIGLFRLNNHKSKQQGRKSMLQVKDLMTRDLFTLQETDNLALAKSLMNLARIRHIPIINSVMDFVGLLTHRDILSATVSRLADVDMQTREELDLGIPVREIMNTKITTVTSETSLKEAAAILLEHKYGCLPVVKNRRLVGILTEADFLSLTISLMNTLEESGM